MFSDVDVTSIESWSSMKERIIITTYAFLIRDRTQGVLKRLLDCLHGSSGCARIKLHDQEMIQDENFLHLKGWLLL